MRKLLSLMAIFVISLMSVSLVSAAFQPGEVLIRDQTVEVNDIDVELLTQTDIEMSSVDNEPGLIVEEGETLDIQIVVESTTNANDIQVEAEIRGYEYDDYEDLSDRAHVFDLDGTPNAPARKRVDLSINMPNQLEDDRYLLRITVDDKDSASLIGYVVLQVEPRRHGIDIADVVFSPGNTVKAGRSLLTSVLLENYGDKDEKDVKVTVEIPELGLRTVEFVDNVETDDHNVDFEDVPELFLPIPANAQEGEYAVKVTAQYDNLREVVSKTYALKVVGNEAYGNSGKLILAVGPESQTVAAGQTARYGVALTNEGQTSKAYVISALAGDWANANVEESLVVLEPGRSKVVNINVDVINTAVTGTYPVSVTVASGDEVLQTVSLNADVVASSSSANLRNGLEIALIVLVVLLVIIGLIVGFSRLRKSEEEDQMYY